MGFALNSQYQISALSHLVDMAPLTRIISNTIVFHIMYSTYPYYTTNDNK
jgi:hypothetical protein